ncbi:2-hydroxy-3-keto-5-methylthiopentenyl-1-phosphate phosphatase [Exiguobacterium sp. MH3]|uniref:2-hydroxy-3-keto-5-methylthiopentenyl-1- phosphate phosphatase n=1 Tax=Exiguobacterium sp. MH3 TaxID=1399115 RepID=UPI0003C3AFA0|nr:2-hydroxy-3-keto-5-methylthiopentenyl-1-phosphate phosphatase [Exiguobacterium sp. MH3]AHA28745.1 2-hydroxy-3-keto-5-methylthiopentenyl-1-phosphate phosphatase [Exiguobacterium sp. MH3]
MTVRILCDFDGTVTTQDNIIALMQAFAPASDFEPLKHGVLDRTLSIQSGVGQMFALLPSDGKASYLDFLLERAVIRDGFSELLQYSRRQDIDFSIVSGGMDFFVEPILAPFLEQERIYCNVANFDGPFVHIDWPNACDTHCTNGCGCCKTSVARTLRKDGDVIIVIGDSVTDFELAKQADRVYARDYLITLCEENDIAYTPFETFHDIVHDLTRAEVTT